MTERRAWARVLHPLEWSPRTVERCALVLFGVARWTMILMMVGATVGFLAWFGASLYNDEQLSRHGAVVTARIVDKVPYGRETVDGPQNADYLLSFTIDGRPDMQWISAGAGLTVGSTESVTVDRTDHARLDWTASHRHRLGGLRAATTRVSGLRPAQRPLRPDGRGRLPAASTGPLRW